METSLINIIWLPCAFTIKEKGNCCENFLKVLLTVCLALTLSFIFYIGVNEFFSYAPFNLTLSQISCILYALIVVSVAIIFYL